MARDHRGQRLPEERQFTIVVVATCAAAGAFLLVFILLTLIKAACTPSGITADYFSAWGTWAGGLATAAAFLIAAYSVAVASAHAREDRREAARIQENNDMAQARLFVIYKVEIPDSISSLATFRLENRSHDYFFDVTVPYVDSPDQSQAGFEHRTPELVASENRLHEFLPNGELLTSYRSHTEHETWFTLVTVHTADWRRVRFFVEYTDAGGRRWRQHLGGAIEPVFTTEAIAVREADRFQPRQQIRRMTNIESYRAGGMFARGLPLLEKDEEFLEVIGVTNVVRWNRIERIGDLVPRSATHDDPGVLVLTIKPAAPPFWEDHLMANLRQHGFSTTGGSSDGRSQSIYLRPPNLEEAEILMLVDQRIEHANDHFEANELAAAKRALESRRAGHQ